MSDAVEPMVPADPDRAPLSADSTPPARRRTFVVVAVAALALIGGLLDRVPRPDDDGPTAATSLVATMPVAAPPTSLSSTWFCAGGMATSAPVDGMQAEGAVAVANAGDRALTGTVTVVPSEGEPKTVPLEVGPRSRRRFLLSEVVRAPYASALVELDGGDVVVEHEIFGALGISTAPCAAAASDRWHFAEGSTAREDSMRLVIFNPFPEDAIVDLSFSTDQGRAVPSNLTGLVVKGGRNLIVKVEEHVRRRLNVSTTAVARSGRIVVDRLQLRGGAVKGISLALGAPSPGRRWYFPEGFVSDGIGERYHLYNPTGTEAQVSIELTLDEGAAEPFDLTIAPRGRITVVASEEERVPRGVGHAATVVSLNDVPVVAERSVTATSPASRSGISDSLGIRETARTWVLAAGAATDTHDEVVVLHNPSATAASASIRGLVGGQLLDVATLQEVALPAGRRVAVRLTDHIKRDELPLLIRASSPIVVERGVYVVGGPGIGLSAAIPLR
ncbi:MAG TPA: DUF5719 family protein [Acidimicrobiales bacterium]|nr:DUF5719 family protein [Acidimicrobiales bacterium]